MKNSTKNKMKMYEAVVTVCTSNESQWAFVPAFQNAFLDFNADYLLLCETNEIHSKVLTGHSKIKSEAFKSLLPMAMNFVNSLSILAEVNGDLVLLERVKIPISTFSRGAVSTKIARFNLLKEHATSNISALSDFGLTQTDLDNFDLAIEKYQTAASVPRQAIIARKQLTKEIARIEDKLDENLNKHLDRCMHLMERFNPNFANLYFDARVVIKYKGKSNNGSSKGEDPVIEEPDDGIE